RLRPGDRRHRHGGAEAEEPGPDAAVPELWAGFDLGHGAGDAAGEAPGPAAAAAMADRVPDRRDPGPPSGIAAGRATDHDAADMMPTIEQLLGIEVAKRPAMAFSVLFF